MAEDPSSLSSSSSHYNHALLEFLLRQPIPNSTVHKILLHLPIAGPLPRRLLKTILLRRLSSFPISEQSLLSLELIHSLNLGDGAYSRRPSLLPLIQAAYLHAAVGSTLAPLANGDLPDFFDAVRRIWPLRIGDLASSEVKEEKGLVSDELNRWKRKMEAAVEGGGSETRDRILMEWTVEAGMEAVREYLAMEMEVMGKTVLEMEAEKLLDRGVVGDEKREDEANGCVVIGGENLGLVANGVGFGGCNLREDGRQEENREEEDESLKGIGNGDIAMMEGGVSDGLGGGDDLTRRQTERAELCVGSRRVEGGESLDGVGKSSVADGVDSGECNLLEDGRQGETNVSLENIGNGDGVSMEGGASDGLGGGEDLTGRQTERAELGVSSWGIDSAISSGTNYFTWSQIM